MKKLILLTFLILIPFLRYYALDFKKSRHLLVSFFVTSIPFQIAFPVYKINSVSGGGTIGTTFQLLLPIALILLILTIFSVKRLNFRFDTKFWPIAFLIIVGLALLNPYNEIKLASLVFLVFIASHFIFFKIIVSLLSEEEIIKGTYDGLVILCTIQFILAICFPLLNIKAVTSLFYDGAEGWSTRHGGRPGAVGTFTHPGNLALFCTIAASFLFGSYLSNYRKKTSLFFLVIIGFTVILTYSRTSYLTIILVLFFILFVSRNAHKNIFSFYNVLKFILPIILVLGYIVFYSPLSDIFLKSDAEEMYMARLMHWLMAFDIFKYSPFIGAGLNTHLEFFATHSLTMNSVDINNTFIISNPIHNIHLIVLAENGIVGLALWIGFIFYNIIESKRKLANGNGNKIISLSVIGVVVAYSVYGITGWAPFSAGILPFFLYFTFLSSTFRKFPSKPLLK